MDQHANAFRILPIAAATAILLGAQPVAADDSAPAPREDPRPGNEVSQLADNGERPSPDAIPVGLAVAEEKTAPSGTPPARSRLIEEIVVTAQKRDESLQEVPISISAFSADKMDALGVVSTGDLPKLTPGLTFTELAGYRLIYLRGVGTDTYIPSADQSVPTYLDGIFIPTTQGLSETLGNIKRVEVLKGPQGTLFGRNSTGGAINIITADPGDTFSADLRASYGSFRSVTSRASVDIPIVESLSTNVSGMYSHADPYYDRIVNGVEEGIPAEQVKAGKVTAFWRPLADLSLKLNAQFTRQSGAGSMTDANTKPSQLGELLGIRAPQHAYETSASFRPLIDIRRSIYYGELTWSLPWLDAKLLVSDSDSKSVDLQNDFDGSDGELVSLESDNQFAKYKTGEIQLLSNDESWGSDWFNWVAGSYYLEGDVGYDPIVINVDVLGGVTDPLPDALVTLLSATGINTSRTQITSRGTMTTKSYAGFAQTTASITGWLRATGGIRYQDEKRVLSDSVTSVIVFGDDEVNALRFPSQSTENDNLSSRLAIDADVSDTSMIYASRSTAFKSGTFNIVNPIQPSGLVLPEKVTSYELGIKFERSSGSLRVNAAVFETKIKDLQTSYVSLTGGGLLRLYNAGGARIRGAEYDLLWCPMPSFNPGLVITTGGTYLDAVFTSFREGAGYDEDTGLFFGPNAVTGAARDFTGNRVTRTPKFSGNVGLNQSMSLGPGVLEAGADAYYNSGFYFLPQNAGFSHQDRYVLIGARVSYLFEPANLRISLLGSNLGDRRYRLSEFDNDFGRKETSAPPRAYTFQIQWSFDR